MPQEIRLATATDRAAVETLVADAYAHYVPRLGREPGPMGDDYAALIADGRVRIAERGGSILGILVLIPEPAAMLLDNIAVAPSAQGTGVGRALLDFAEAAAREAGYDHLRLYTHQLMVENIALYRRLGYVETHRGEEKGLSRVYMTKTLDPRSSTPASGEQAPAGRI